MHLRYLEEGTSEYMIYRSGMPHEFPAPPANVLVPSGGHPQIYVKDPPDQTPDDEIDPISIIRDQLTPGVLANMYNVRVSFPVGLGTPHIIRSLGPPGLTLYTSTTRNKWNLQTEFQLSPRSTDTRLAPRNISVGHSSPRTAYFPRRPVCLRASSGKKILGTGHFRVARTFLRCNSTSSLTGLIRHRFGATLQTRNVPTRQRKIITWMLRLTRRCR